LNYQSIAWVDRLIYHPAFYLSIAGLALISAFTLDISIATYFHEQSHTWFHTLAEATTDLGYGKYYIIVLALISLNAYFIFDKPLLARISLFLLLCIMIPGAVVDVLKFIFSRARPIEFFEHGVYGLTYFQTEARFFSFPSGHASTIFGLCMGIGYLLPRFLPLVLCLALSIASTRIIVTAHYTSDVLSGALIALLCVPLIHRYLFRGLKDKG
jgi:membrane-associated phospholipid phosphatase